MEYPDRQTGARINHSCRIKRGQHHSELLSVIGLNACGTSSFMCYAGLYASEEIL
jgi:hypothetical protein